MGLVAVGIAEGDVYAGKFFVLQKIADHLRKPEVGAEGEFADAVAVFVGVAIIPEFLLQVLALAFHLLQPRAFDFEDQRSALQVAVLAAEVVSGRGVTNKSAVDSGRSGEDFAGGQIGPIAWTDQATGLDPIEAAIEMRGEFGACFGFYRKRLGAQHTLTKLVAEPIHETIVGAHSLLHDFRRDADHVRVANLATLDNLDDRHARAELAGLRGHAQDADIGGFQGVEYGSRRQFDWTRAEIFE